MSASEEPQPKPEWNLVTDDEGVKQAADLLASSSGPVGIDAERASGFRYGQNAYLVQAYRRGQAAFLFDPTTINDFSPLADALEHEEWILHAANQDIPCLSELGLSPSRLFDTELAARLLGYERVGLGAIVESLLGVTLAKAHSASDWSTRPLPESWLEYAALDVTLLPDLRDVIHDELVQQNKLDYAEQEFIAVRDQPPKPADPEAWRRLKGLQSLRDPRKQTIARELWSAREQFAQLVDTSPGRLLPDASIIAAAAANPRSPRDLASLKTFQGRASRTELNRWWKAILRGKTSEVVATRRPHNPDAIPHHRGWAERYPEAAARLTAARTALEAEAIRINMPVENLLTPALLRRVVWDPPDPATQDAIADNLRRLGAREWQIALTSPIIAIALDPSL